MENGQVLDFLDVVSIFSHCQFIANIPFVFTLFSNGKQLKLILPKKLVLRYLLAIVYLHAAFCHFLSTLQCIQQVLGPLYEIPRTLLSRYRPENQRQNTQDSPLFSTASKPDIFEIFTKPLTMCNQQAQKSCIKNTHPLKWLRTHTTE